MWVPEETWLEWCNLLRLHPRAPLSLFDGALRIMVRELRTFWERDGVRPPGEMEQEDNERAQE